MTDEARVATLERRVDSVVEVLSGIVSNALMVELRRRMESLEERFAENISKIGGSIGEVYDKIREEGERKRRRERKD